MTVQRIVDRTSHFEWLSTDTRPVTGLSVGDLGYETDTKKWYGWNETEWVFRSVQGMAADLIDGLNYPRVKQVFGSTGEVTDVTPTSRLPVETSPVLLQGISTKLGILIKHAEEITMERFSEDDLL